MKSIFNVNLFWPIISRERQQPAKPEPLDDGDNVSAAEKAAWQAIYDLYVNYCLDKAAALTFLLESIVDDTVAVFKLESADPILLWEALHETYARKSRTARIVASRNFHGFHHEESDTAMETIRRFESINLACTDQGVTFTEAEKENKLLESCNERYDKVQERYDAARMDLKELKDTMQGADDTYQRRSASKSSSVTRAEALSNKKFDDRFASYEILWAQKHSRAG